MRQRVRDVAFPSRGAYQAFVEPVRLPELEADAIDRVDELPRRGLLAKGMQDPPLMQAQIGGRTGRRRTGGEPAQHRRVMRLRFFDSPLARLWRELGLESQHLIDEVEIPRIVQQSLVGRDLGIDADPESNVRLEFSGTCKRPGRSGSGRGGV